MKFAEVNERGDFSTFFDARVNTIYVVDAVFLDQGNLPVRSRADKLVHAHCIFFIGNCSTSR